MSKQSPNNLKATIDKMVRESIQRILPEVMNEVLLRTLANANVVQEQRQPAPRRQPSPPGPSKAAQRAQQLAGVDRGRSLRDVLQAEESGTDFYERAERMMEGRQPRRAPAPQPVQQHHDYEFDFDDDDEQPDPRESLREQVIAQRISQLPPQLQALAEDTFNHAMDDDVVGEMWGDDEMAPDLDGFAGDSDMVQPKAPPLNIERAARIAGVDFSRAQKLMQITEKKTKVNAADKLAEAQWKQEQLERYRESLNRKA